MSKHKLNRFTALDMTDLRINNTIEGRVSGEDPRPSFEALPQSENIPNVNGVEKEGGEGAILETQSTKTNTRGNKTYFELMRDTVEDNGGLIPPVTNHPWIEDLMQKGKIGLDIRKVKRD